MEDRYTNNAPSAQKTKSSLKPVLIAVLVSFLLGGAGAYYLLRGSELPQIELFDIKDRDADRALSGDPTLELITEEPEQVVAEAREAVERVEQVVEQQGGLDQRLAAMEQRLTRLDLQAEAAVGNVARAEGLLIAFATRRALERGGELGYLADQLRLRFGDARPNAVQTVINVAQDPVTLDQLLARLDGLSEVLSQAPSDEAVWTRFGREVSQLFVVRNQDTPSPRTERRLERARVFIETSQIDNAVMELSNLPNAEQAADWISDAQRYAAGQTALEVLETAAILDTHELRDGAGVNVEQVSPASGSSGG